MTPFFVRDTNSFKSSSQMFFEDTTHDYSSHAFIFYYSSVGIIGVGAIAGPAMAHAQSSLS